MSVNSVKFAAAFRGDLPWPVKVLYGMAHVYILGVISLLLWSLEEAEPEVMGQSAASIAFVVAVALLVILVCCLALETGMSARALEKVTLTCSAIGVGIVFSLLPLLNETGSHFALVGLILITTGFASLFLRPVIEYYNVSAEPSSAPVTQ